MLGLAPAYVLNMFHTVLYGIVAAYAVLMMLLGKPGFFSRSLQTVIAVSVAYGVGRLLGAVLQRTAAWGQSSGRMPAASTKKT